MNSQNAKKKKLEVETKRPKRLPLHTKSSSKTARMLWCVFLVCCRRPHKLNMIKKIIYDLEADTKIKNIKLFVKESAKRSIVIALIAQIITIMYRGFS